MVRQTLAFYHDALTAGAVCLQKKCCIGCNIALGILGLLLIAVGRYPHRVLRLLGRRLGRWLTWVRCNAGVVIVNFVDDRINDGVKSALKIEAKSVRPDLAVFRSPVT